MQLRVGTVDTAASVERASDCNHGGGPGRSKAVCRSRFVVEASESPQGFKFPSQQLLDMQCCFAGFALMNGFPFRFGASPKDRARTNTVELYHQGERQLASGCSNSG